MGLVLHLLYRRRIEAALTALEDLFAQWKAGTLAPLAVALPVPAVPAMRVRMAAPAPAAGGQARAPAAPRVRVPAARRKPAPPAVAARVRAAAWPFPSALRAPAPAWRALRLLRRDARCTKNCDARARFCMPILLHSRNNIRHPEQLGPKSQKFFCFFFFKKRRLFLPLALPAPLRDRSAPMEGPACLR
jgi:hypothetical protein